MISTNDGRKESAGENMKVEPQAIKLLREWNGNVRHDFPEVLKAYRLGMRVFNDNDAVCELIHVWLARVNPIPFVRVLQYYVDTAKLVQELLESEEPLLEAHDITTAIDKQAEIDAAYKARNEPMPLTSRDKKAIKKLSTTYLDGDRRAG